MKAQTGPVIVVDNSGIDLVIFDSVDEAQGYLEPIDIQNNEYVVYDSRGRLFKLCTHKNKVVLTMPENPEVRYMQLLDSLKQFLTATGKSTELAHNNDVLMLIDACRSLPS